MQRWPLREHQEVARLENTYGNYREISAQVQITYGDKGVLSEEHLQLLAQAIPQCETHRFAGLDHFGIDEKAPQQVAEVMSRFLLG